MAAYKATGAVPPRFATCFQKLRACSQVSGSCSAWPGRVLLTAYAQAPLPTTAPVASSRSSAFVDCVPTSMPSARERSIDGSYPSLVLYVGGSRGVAGALVLYDGALSRYFLCTL